MNERPGILKPGFRLVLESLYCFPPEDSNHLECGCGVILLFTILFFLILENGAFLSTLCLFRDFTHDYTQESAGELAKHTSARTSAQADQ